MSDATNAGASKDRTDALERLMRIEALLWKALHECKEQLSPEPRREVDRAVAKQVAGTLRKPGLGKLVGILRDSCFIRKWEHKTGREFDALRMIELNALNDFRNALAHGEQDARRVKSVSPLDLRLLELCIELIEDAFGFSANTAWFGYLCTLRDNGTLTAADFRVHLTYIAECDLPDTETDFELLQRLSQGDSVRQDIRARQVLSSIELTRPVRLSRLDISFVLCVPPGDDEPFYAAETLVSQWQWSRVRDGIPGTGDPTLARTGLSFADAETFTILANQASQSDDPDLEMALPTRTQWAALAAYAEHSTVPLELTEPRLQTADATASGLHDLFGVAFQFCADKVARGGHYSSRRRDFADAEEDTTDTTHENPVCGFRPVLLIRRS